MSIFTVAECDEMIVALKAALIASPPGGIRSVTVGDKTIQYSSIDDIHKSINMWVRLKSDAMRAAAGVRRGMGSLADFTR